MTPFPAPNRLHVWWARRPLVASRAAMLASLLPADADREQVHARARDPWRSRGGRRSASTRPIERASGSAQTRTATRARFRYTPTADRTAVARDEEARARPWRRAHGAGPDGGRRQHSVRGGAAWASDIRERSESGRGTDSAGDGRVAVDAWLSRCSTNSIAWRASSIDWSRERLAGLFPAEPERRLRSRRLSLGSHDHLSVLRRSDSPFAELATRARRHWRAAASGSSRESAATSRS